jgi:hypothetical protein
MPSSGCLPLSGGDGQDLHCQIRANLGLLLLLPLLQWLEGGDAGSSIVFRNNLVATSSSYPLDISKGESLLAGRGDEGRGVLLL